MPTLFIVARFRGILLPFPEFGRGQDVIGMDLHKNFLRLGQQTITVALFGTVD